MNQYGFTLDPTGVFVVASPQTGDRKSAPCKNCGTPLFYSDDTGGRHALGFGVRGGCVTPRFNQ